MQRVVIVTGAGGWLGSAIVKAFVDAGDKVLVADSHKESLDQVVATTSKGPGPVIACTVDTRNYGQVEDMVSKAVKTWGRLDLMVCVAGGILTRLKRVSRVGEKLLVDHTEEDWDLVVDSNLKGSFHCIKAAAAPMMAQKDGQILLMGSGAGSKGSKKRAAYSAAKAGMLGLMKTAALELGEHNVRVNVISPGRNPHPGEVSNPEGNILPKTNTPPDVAAFFVHVSRMTNISGQIFNLDSRILF